MSKYIYIYPRKIHSVWSITSLGDTNLPLLLELNLRLINWGLSGKGEDLFPSWTKTDKIDVLFYFLVFDWSIGFEFNASMDRNFNYESWCLFCN